MVVKAMRTSVKEINPRENVASNTQRHVPVFNEVRQILKTPRKVPSKSNAGFLRRIDKGMMGVNPTRLQVQTKLAIKGPEDEDEKDANNIVAKMESRIVGSFHGPAEHKVGYGGKLDLKPKVNRSRSAQTHVADSEGLILTRSFEAELQRARINESRSLHDDVLYQWNNLLGEDFSSVKIHSGAESDRLSQSLNARAFTIGKDIFFRQGMYNPRTNQGKKLLAHELTHIMQESRNGSGDGTIIRLNPEVRHGRTYATLRVPWADWYTFRERVEQQVLTQLEVPRTWIPQLMHVNQQQLLEIYNRIEISVRPVDDQIVEVEGWFDARREVGNSSLRFQLPRVSPESSESESMGITTLEMEQLEITGIIPTALEMEQLEITGTVPRIGPAPIERTSGWTQRHLELLRRPRIPSGGIEEWTTWSSVVMEYERLTAPEGRSASTADYKDRWVRAHRHVIREVAREYDLPDWLIAGVAWIEVGGEPGYTDDLSYILGDLGIRGSPERASYGAVAMQILRAAEELGYDPRILSRMQTSSIINSLRDPQQNLFLVGSHLDRLRNIDFPGWEASMLSDYEVSIIATRYNRGPDLTLEQIEQNKSYGDFILERRDELQMLLED